MNICLLMCCLFISIITFIIYQYIIICCVYIDKILVLIVSI